jgi:hypothetical protein
MFGSNFIRGAANLVKRLYMQFIMIIIVSFALGLLIDPLFSMADFKLRIFFSAALLLALSAAVFLIDRY